MKLIDMRRTLAYGIPKRTLDVTLCEPPSPAMDAVLRWIDSPKWFLCLGGGPGCGKTTAAAAALLTLGGQMVTAMETTDHLFDRPWWAELETFRVVAIDDLGTEKPDGEGYWQTRWFSLADQRYRTDQRMVITTNMTRDDWIARYCEGDGGRTRDRLREGGVFASLSGASMRRGEP